MRDPEVANRHINCCYKKLQLFLISLCLGTLLNVVLYRTVSTGQQIYQFSTHTRKTRALKTASNRTRLTRPNKTWRKNGLLYEIPAFGVSILSAIGRNRSASGGWDEIILNGWEGRNYFGHKFDCCFHYPSGEVKKTAVTNKNHWLQCKAVHYTAVQFTCPNPGRHNGSYPDGIALVSSDGACSVKQQYYMDIFYPQKQANHSIALCAKIAYGSISPRRMIEWYEIQKHFGVNKILTFAYNVSLEARKVLRYYERQGLLDAMPYQYPNKGSPKRNVGEKTAQVFNDEQVVVFDCAERLAGYTYVGILDHDEFIVPSPAYIRTWKDMFGHFLRRKSNASGFSFRTELFITDWGKIDNTSSYFVTQFLNRTRPMWDRVKNIYLPERVVPGSVWTHDFASVPGYEKFLVPSGLATLKHYRPCRKEWLERNKCFNRRRFEDRKMIRVVDRLNTSDIP